MTEDRRAFAFGPFRLEPAHGTLLRDGRAVPLPPKIFEMLVQLVEADGRLVTKDALLAAIWPDTFVEEGSLTYTVSMLRKLLGDDASSGYIVTVPKRGYRFGASIAVVESRAATQAGEARDPPRPASPAAHTRLLVLPFRVLRSDADTDFLSFSLPDAVAGALSGLQSLVVRCRLDGPPGDPATAAAGADVDLVLTGSLLRNGDQLRVAVRLVEVGSGTLVSSSEWQVPLGDLYQLQDRLQRRIVESLAVPLTPNDQRRLAHRGPATARAYEFYLRANQLAYEAGQWQTARDLFLQSVAEDPEYAPAWARLARCHRVIGKFASRPAEYRENLTRAEEAFTRALALDPDLSVAHNLYAQLEVDLGRAPAAMARLLARAAANPHDPETYAGLVAACRFCGLLDASVTAHERARALDASILTSVAHSFWLRGDPERALGETHGDIGYMPGLALMDLGRVDEALAVLRWREAQTAENRARLYLTSLRALVEQRRDESMSALCELSGEAVDPEGLFYIGRTFAYWTDVDRAIDALGRAVDGGFYAAATDRADSWLAPLAGDPRFAVIRGRAIDGRRAAADAFQRASTPLTSTGCTSSSVP